MLMVYVLRHGVVLHCCSAFVARYVLLKVSRVAMCPVHIVYYRCYRDTCLASDYNKEHLYQCVINLFAQAKYEFREIHKFP